VCGYQEYPGPPSDAGKSGSALADPDVQADELGGLFIQCDVCKVWQHGGCVGIMDEAASPDEYFCEECRKDLHKVTMSPKGQKYSRYLPVYDQQQNKNRKSSISKESDGHSGRDKDRNNRASVDSFGKRRSTMNSRAAYDEDEVLRKVIEESKHQGAPASRTATERSEVATIVKKQSQRSNDSALVLGLPAVRQSLNQRTTARKRLPRNKSHAALQQRVNARKNSARRSARATGTKLHRDGKDVPSGERETIQKNLNPHPQPL